MWEKEEGCDTGKRKGERMGKEMKKGQGKGDQECGAQFKGREKRRKRNAQFFIDRYT